MGLVGVIGILLVAFLLYRPETIRTSVQVPVGVTVRNSHLGIGNVVQVRNVSGKALVGVVLVGKNYGHNTSASYRIGNLQPGEVREVGWMEWHWKVDPDETITVGANDFLPIVFSSAQLGIR